MKKIFCCYILITVSFFVHAQEGAIKLYPTNWWAGMKNPKLQLMLHGEGIGESAVSLHYPHVKVDKVYKAENKNYVFVDLNIDAAAKPGILKFVLSKNGGSTTVDFELKKRRSDENGKTRILGVTSADLIYLIMPDRFANGDPSNDRIAGMAERVNGRDSLKGRHGGDLQGVKQHLDYLKDLGITAIWLNPVLESDRERESFHGYAFTDHYKIDPRFGGEEAYHALIEAAHAKYLKVIQDAVYNHVDINHVTVKDMPMKDWLNQWPSFQNTSYKDQVLMDPYAAQLDKKIMSDGWFNGHMPDLNQQNPYVANFLIQHAIWTTENFGIDGWRIDTYAYCDLAFMNRCNKALLDEYPQLGIFAETWVHGMTNQSFFVKNNYNNISFTSNLPGVTDFQMYFAMNDALNQNFGWTEGLSKLNLTLAADFVYADPQKNCLFLDNHDLTRFYTAVGENFSKYKMGINWLLTLRGIPQLYYGTEILMTGSTSPTDALVRKDFPGGWKEDTINKFIPAGRTPGENEAFNYVRTLAGFRKNSSALKTGRLMQFVPFDGLYIYFRYDKDQTVMVVSNTNNKPADVQMSRFAERTKGFNHMKDIFSGKTNNLDHFTIDAWGSAVYELIK
jgi:glycosidase